MPTQTDLLFAANNNRLRMIILARQIEQKPGIVKTLGVYAVVAIGPVCIIKPKGSTFERSFDLNVVGQVRDSEIQQNLISRV
jgi:hypothetical protein